MGAVGDGLLVGDRLHLVLGVAEVGEVAEGDVLQRVAGRAHLAIDLQTALQSMAVVGAEGAGEAPVHLRQRRALAGRSEEHTSELQSLMRISYAVFCLNKKKG